MITRALSRTIRRFFRGLRFPGQRGEAARKKTREILDVFVDGVEARLLGRSPAAVERVAGRLPWHRRSFFWEGYAIGLAGQHALAFRRGCPDQRRITSHYRAVHFTGYGLWNGLARLYPLPRVSLRPERWAGVADYPKYVPVIVGGAAFAEVFFRGRLERGLAPGPRISGDRAFDLGALHGCGRALWFLYMDHPEGLEPVLRGHGEIRSDLLEGLGFALGFTNADDPERIVALLERFPVSDRPAVARGIGVSFLALVQDDPENERRVAAFRQERLREAREAVRRADARASPGRNWYREASELARSFLPDGGHAGPSRAVSRFPRNKSPLEINKSALESL